jgi:hypothetical protein
MTTQTMENAGYLVSGRTERMQDLLLVSSFLWAVLLGLMPVLTLRLLMGS